MRRTQTTATTANASTSIAGSASIDAGDFGTWLAQVLASFRGSKGAQVPCGECRGCCTSSYFIHVRSDDRKTLEVVPKALLFPAIGLPRGHRLMGFAPDGCCPMFKDRECSIYHHRPQTCRDYDCRVFAAAGIDAGGPDKATINQRVREWQFSYASDRDRQAHEATKAAAAFIEGNRAAFPGGRAPVAPGDIAVLAIEVHHVFLMPEAENMTAAERAEAIVRASREFDALRGEDGSQNAVWCREVALPVPAWPVR
jgi:Fe-S-cluster containining protein